MTQFNEQDTKVTSDFLALLINLGMTPTDAYKTVDKIISPLGWSFVYFNDHEDFWIMDNEMK